MRAENRIGLKFGLLKVVARSEVKNKNGCRKWTVECECGNFKDVEFSSLKQGLTKSCGCLNRKLSSERAKERSESQVGVQCLKDMQKANRGRMMPAGPASASPNNCHAKYWSFRNGEGELIRGINLADLIRLNSRLFDSDDVIVREKKDGRNYTRAANGLRGLASRLTKRKPPTSWKGWVLVEKGES